MTDSPGGKINVVVAMDFSDSIMQMLNEVSPKLNIQHHFPDVPEAVWADAEVLYTTNKLPQPEQAPRLRWIQFNSAGIDHAMSHPIVQTEDVDVTTASGIHATHMSEFCLAMILAFEFKLLKMVEFKATAEWSKDKNQIFVPHGLRGKTLGIAGYGSIGRELARVANTLGMRVLVTKTDVMHPEDPNGYTLEGTGDPQGIFPERIYPPEALASMSRECDYLVLTTPLTPKTRHMVDADLLGVMKKTAVLINVARGGVVDEAALISALAAEKIAGAGLDVFEEEPLPSTSPLWNLDNVIISPHVAGLSTTYHEKAAALFAENLRRYVEKRPLLNLIERKRGY